MAMIMAKVKERIVNGMVMVNPGSRIFPKESTSRLNTFSLIANPLSHRYDRSMKSFDKIVKGNDKKNTKIDKKGNK